MEKNKYFIDSKRSKKHRRISKLKLKHNIGIIVNSSLSDRALAKLYRCSLAFVYPSLYEGFGIPPLEAMSCKTAVIAANCSSIPEVVGDGGILFDPKSTNELTDSLLMLLDCPTERDRLIEKGY